MATPVMDVCIYRYVARIRFGEFLHRAAECGAAFLFAFGGIVLVAKLLLPQAWPHVLWLGGAAIPALIVAWWLSRRERWTRGESIARLDSALQSGGLLMTLSERPDADWSAQLPQVEALWRSALPRLRPRRFASYLALPLVFAFGACFVPLREASSDAPLRNTVGRKATQELEELLASLDEEKVLEQEEQRQLNEEIAKLAEETEHTPLTHEKWETVDALRERMRVRLDAAAMTAAQAASAAAMLKGAGLDGNELSLERSEQLQKELAETLQKLGQKGAFAGASKSLQDQLQRLIKDGKLQLPEDAAERERLLDELREHLQKESDKLCELRGKCSQCDGDKLCLGEKDGNGNLPGRGGVSRGRGDADLTWGKESDKEGTKFKEVILPPGFLDQPKDELVGVQKTAPNEDTAANAPRSAQRLLDPAAGNATWNRTVNPRHRGVVRKFFDERAN